MNISNNKHTNLDTSIFSNEQQQTDWFLGLYDPTSARCDEILEGGTLLDELDGSASLLSPKSSYRSHDFSSEDLCDVCACGACRSGQPRSRSEDKKRHTNDIYVYRCNSAEPAQETSAPHTTSSSCYSQSCSLSHSEHSVSPVPYAEPGSHGISLPLSPVRRKTKGAASHSRRCRRNTVSCGCDTSHDHTSDIPPPMALIDVNRLSLQNLTVSLSGTDHIPSPSECTRSFISPLDTTHSFLSAPKLHLRSNISLNSSGTGSWTEPEPGTKDNNNNSPQRAALESSAPSEQSGIPRLRTPLPRLTDTSARDSGLSSHSSNSAYLSVSQSQHESAPVGAQRAHQLTESQCGGSVPPPIPPHAPNSYAAAAAAAAARNQIPCGSTISRSTSGVSNRVSVNESMCGSHTDNPTLRLTPFSLMKPELKDVDEAHTKPGFHVGYRSGSPIWKRNRDSACDTVPPNSERSHPATSFTASLVASQSPMQHSGSVCPRCLNARRYFLDWARPSACLRAQDTLPPGGPKSSEATTGAQNCQTCRQHILSVGVNLFNRDPLHGLMFLNRHQVVNLNSAENIAQFILSTPGLARSGVGAFLGLPHCGPIVPIEVMRCLLERLDFRNLEIDEALRLVVYHFGIPVESQEIDRFLECLASHYHSLRWSTHAPSELPVTRDQVLLLLYSILLLQTSLYNANAANSTMGKQTVNQFIRNSQMASGFVHSDSPTAKAESIRTHASRLLDTRENPFSEPVLQEIYQRIRAKPLAPGPDHTQLVKRISARLSVPRLPRKCGCQWDDDRQWLRLCGRLAEPHRRFVCLCTMVQFVRRPRSRTKVALLRYALLFNDLLILTKHERPERSASRHRLRASDQQQIRQGLLALLRNAPVRAHAKQSHRLLNAYLRPPTALLCGGATHDRTESPVDSYHLRSTELSCIPRTVVNSRPPSTERPTGLPLRHQSGKLFVMRMISLSGCRLRLFETEDCRFGLELWKPVSQLAAGDPSKPHRSDQAVRSESNSNNNRLTLVATLAALTERDYEHFLADLIACLRESHTVFREQEQPRRPKPL